MKSLLAGFFLFLFQKERVAIWLLFFIFIKTLSMEVQMEASWKNVLKNEFTKPYFQQIVTFLKTEKAAGKII